MCILQIHIYTLNYYKTVVTIFIINLGETWDELYLAVRVIVAIENLQDIIFQSARPYGQGAILKFSQYTGVHPIAGRCTPSTFTNQLQISFSKPLLLILADPRTDHQPIKEAFAFCGTDSPMGYVDIGIPANNKGKHSMGCLFWLLARMVLQICGTVAPGHKWDVMVDMFFYKEPEEAKENEEAEAVLPGPNYGVVLEYQGMGATDQWGGADTNWNDSAVQVPVHVTATDTDWADQVSK